MISAIEAVNNAIQHGNREEERRQVHIRVETTPENIAICVRDEGEGFDLDLVPDPRSGEEAAERLGPRDSAHENLRGPGRIPYRKAEDRRGDVETFRNTVTFQEEEDAGFDFGASV